MKTKRVLAGFLTAAMVIGMSQPVMINPVFAEEGTQEQTGEEIQDLTQMNKLVNMIDSLYESNVLYTEAPDFQTDIDSLRLEDKSYLLDYYQYHNAQEDDRISGMLENGTENNIATKEALCEIMTDLVGAADEDVMNYVYSDYYISTDGDTCYLRAYGSYGAPPSNFILSDIQSVEDTGDQRILMGEVYDWSDPDYAQGIMNPKGSYRIVVVPSGSHLFDGYTFKEITVTSGSREEASAPTGEASADEEADLQDMTALMYSVVLLEHSCMYGKGSTFSDAENFWAYSAGYFEDYPVTEETGGGTVAVVPAAEVEAYWNEVQDCNQDPALREEHSVGSISLVEGNRENIKITTPFDLIVAEALVSGKGAHV